MKLIKLLALFVLAVSLTGIAPAVSAGSYGVPANASYFILKGGRYSPGEKYDINNFNGSTASHLDTKTGSNWEIALGQYADTKTALELGIGYFESKASPTPPEPGSTTLKAVPIVVTAKGFMPIGVLRPYIELGVGGYFTKLEVSGNTGSFTSKSKTTYGYHAGVGFNIDLGSKLFIGLEGRYVWAKANYGGQPVKLNGLMSAINLGFRY